jgi:hypothetical protein
LFLPSIARPGEKWSNYLESVAQLQLQVGFAERFDVPNQVEAADPMHA